MMDAQAAKKLVLVGTVGSATIGTIAAYRRTGGAPFRITIGAFAAGTVLAAGAEIAPALAASFAMLMLVSATFVVGGDTWQSISELTKPGAVIGTPPGPPPVTGYANPDTTNQQNPPDQLK